MEVMIIATRDCSHCANLSKEIDNLGIGHRVAYAEDEMDLCQKLDIRHSPNLIVDGKVIYRRQPTEHKLREYFNY
ncbi:thioredoxin family protein [Sulfuriflexus sp.]|uniref:thioredoxin family protein n=1 Tax=Sulfuriflexus sp. TaxID=2015443 RepID=UPI0028CE423A|nr:thioredoxin family protein [Sulfuriflexus sp.]MDT8403196.1 thioredoxin family protein [Sulfuriflexus sp.]